MALTKKEMRDELCKKMKAEYPPYRDEMTIEEERKFVNDLFNYYELEGFANAFWSPNQDFDKWNGMPFQVLGRVPEFPGNEDGTVLECLPMWNIKFPDGHEMAAYPDEIIPSEMKDCGCPADWFKE